MQSKRPQKQHWERGAVVAQSRITAVVDTNLLVRYLTEDDPAKAKAVDDLLARAEQGRERLLVPSVVVAELVWVLEVTIKWALTR